MVHHCSEPYIFVDNEKSTRVKIDTELCTNHTCACTKIMPDSSQRFVTRYFLNPTLRLWMQTVKFRLVGWMHWNKVPNPEIFLGFIRIQCWDLLLQEESIFSRSFVESGTTAKIHHLYAGKMLYIAYFRLSCLECSGLDRAISRRSEKIEWTRRRCNSEKMMHSTDLNTNGYSINPRILIYVRFSEINGVNLAWRIKWPHTFTCDASSLEWTHRR